MTAAEPLLSFDRVSKSFPTHDGTPVTVLHGIDLALEHGDFATITGPSGAGKSTLLHIAAMLDSPTTGAVRFAGVPVWSLDDPGVCALRKHAVGIVFQGIHLLPHRTALDNVLFRFRYAGLPNADARAHAWDALERVGLAPLAARRARLLSGGEAQRVAIARAIALRPRLLVADEPTGNLDPAAAESIMRCLNTLNAEGMAILLVSHAPVAATNRRMRRFGCSAGVLQESA